MAAPGEEAEGFAAWLAARLEALGLDRAVYGAYIQGLLREEESDEERLEALCGVLAACLEEDLLNDVCREVVEKWSESQIVDAKEKKEDDIQAIASMMEKQAKIVVKPKEVSQEEKQRKAALLAQYANVTDEEDGEDEQDGSIATAVNIASEKSLFRNTNVEDVLNARKLERELLRDEFQKKKEQDKLQREKDKLAKQERKEKEKKRTQKGERKR
ncbi:coiled-coil domain-containing protein 43 [Falco biarmicus]|uniref:coiled-coil domain-containing protein 43 n=1 Tax=Falco rusticolus TaxID=120794 RepID=UPI0018869AAE|nr:coiled-coil domain-containing protein 43 [Falco rusticolus]XP_055553614.1 coiled-coil domain-containing protein 43 [Falco cherrug]XP_056218231.1 coiled-coil domain-containing protein 43 [Falco biarmicus]